MTMFPNVSDAVLQGFDPNLPTKIKYQLIVDILLKPSVV